MLETARLILRPFNKNDVDSVFAMRSSADVMRFIREPQTRRDEAESWINLISSRWETEKIGFCAVIEKSSNQFIGWCGLWRLKETDEIEVGYALVKDFRGKGCASEAAEAFLTYGFEELDLKEIVAVARPENRASWRVMERLGMTYDYTGKFYERDLVHYSITKKEFLAGRNKEKSAAD
ncbi:MAG TPA: GNAT family N-acetyltransferase [Pyrinomonadaceae bacterium]|nr:GNAT family N-acetyltransferase [Pyrinomonadaceae bacterium]